MFIKSIVETPESGTVTVIVANGLGTGEECLILSLGEWKRMLKSLGRDLQETDELDETLYDALHLSAEKTAALREAVRILSSGDKSARQIRHKLTAKGFCTEAADHAAAFLEKKGYLNEEEACLRIARSAVRSKHYGKRRVVAYLLAHGYDPTAAKNAADSIPQEDYHDALAYQMAKKYPHAADMSRAEQQKMIAAMIRQGFAAGDVIRYLKEERL